MNYRKGDVVSVLGVVKHEQGDDERIFVDIKGCHDTVWLKPDDMKMVQPMFCIGESVRWEGHGAGIIHAIKDGHAWIGMASGDYCTRLLTSINRDETPEA